MNLIRVGIYLTDPDYSRALARGLSRASRNMCFTVQAEEGLDLVLRDQPVEKEDTLTLYLDSEDTDDRIFRYADCRSMVDQILQKYEETTGRHSEYHGCKDQKVICFAGTEGASGVTSLCLSLARMIELIYGRRCLYMSLCSLNGSTGFLPTSKDMLQRLLYHIRRGESPDLGPYLDRVTEPDRLRQGLLQPFLGELDGDLIQELLDHLAGMGLYDYLFLDLGTDYSALALTILSHADHLLLIHREGAGNAGKLEATLGSLCRESGVPILPITNLCRSANGSGRRVQYCQSAFVPRGSRIDIDLNTQYGSDVAALGKELVTRVDG